MGLTELGKDSTCNFDLWFRKQKKKDTYKLQVSVLKVLSSFLYVIALVGREGRVKAEWVN